MQTIYGPGGYISTHPSGNMLRRDDDITRTVTTWDAAGVVTSTRPYTAAENTTADAELEDKSKRAVADKLLADTKSDLVKFGVAVDKLAVLLGSDTVPGSIRALMGPSGATAGTASLRALRQQSNTTVVSAASIKALIGLIIDLAQLVIDGDQASRAGLRVGLRQAKIASNDLTSADVRNEI